LTRSSPRVDNGAGHLSIERGTGVNLPIGLTITRIVAVPLLILFLISSSRVHALIAAAIFTAAAFTDWLDGVLARRRNQVTTLGTLLDPIADKLLVAAAPSRPATASSCRRRGWRSGRPSRSTSR
jgi:phosphatidylserine synthase